MSSKIDSLIKRIAEDDRCEIEWRDTSAPLLAPGYVVYHTSKGPNSPKHGVILPADMLHFRERVAKANIFAKTVPESARFQLNGWNLWGVSYWGCETLTESLYYYEGDGQGSKWEQLSQCYHFGNWAGDGAQLLAVDLRPERYGYIIECLKTQMTYGGDVPVIAHSFTEWLERTLDAGPDIEGGYWEQPGFVDYGPALEGDPYYTPRPRLD